MIWYQVSSEGRKCMQITRVFLLLSFQVYHNCSTNAIQIDRHRQEVPLRYNLLLAPRRSYHHDALTLVWKQVQFFKTIFFCSISACLRIRSTSVHISDRIVFVTPQKSKVNRQSRCRSFKQKVETCKNANTLSRLALLVKLLNGYKYTCIIASLTSYYRVPACTLHLIMNQQWIVCAKKWWKEGVFLFSFLFDTRRPYADNVFYCAV